MKTLALFVNQPHCSVQSLNGIVNALHRDYKIKIFTKHELEDDFFDDVDIVCFPGGLGDSDSFDSLLKRHRSRIRRFVQEGGKYLGICMGAYWADKSYFDILDHTRVDQYIKQPGTCTRRPHAKGMNVMWYDEPKTMFFYDGCTFIGGEYETIATYPTGYPMAIIQNNIGLIGCHPESDKHWYDSYSWMKKHWHNDTQGKLLLDFTNKLMEAP